MTRLNTLYSIKSTRKTQNKQRYLERQRNCSRMSLTSGNNAWSSLMVKQEQGKLIQSKAQRKNLALSCRRSNISQLNFKKMVTSWQWHVGWQRSTCNNWKISFGSLVIALNPFGLMMMALSMELLCVQLKMLQTSRNLSTLEFKNVRSATPMPMTTRADPIFSFRSKSRWTASTSAI